MGDHGIIDTFHIFRVFKVARIFDKISEHDAYEKKKVLEPTLCGWSVPGLVPEI